MILSIITVPELLYQVQRMSAEIFRYLEANLVLALFFWGLVRRSRVSATDWKRASRNI
ncbi:ABC-type amino acid transport system permease subunit [Sinorhizobium terangae]|uniref:hypothetical protein n=1 Tax=Sinorhizobium terangae TaxID=110322 RepID=UPI0017DC73F0|nr:hypothetical protein [Sinorhizobium terangae]MBB4187652.1 ABC-type amino acid transport system permease subunit [Sinorhizobium terangae]